MHDRERHAIPQKNSQPLFAGRLGEELLIGAPSDGAGGSAGSDLDRATKLAADMVASLGLLGSASLTYFGPRGSVQEFLRYGEVRTAVAKELSAAEDSCRVLLEARRDALDAVARQLLDIGRIDGREVELLLVKHASEILGKR
jgi:ATP-dependent Zn protease